MKFASKLTTSCLLLSIGFSSLQGVCASIECEHQVTCESSDLQTLQPLNASELHRVQGGYFPSTVMSAFLGQAALMFGAVWVLKKTKEPTEDMYKDSNLSAEDQKIINTIYEQKTDSNVRD